MMSMVLRALPAIHLLPGGDPFPTGSASWHGREREAALRGNDEGGKALR